MGREIGFDGRSAREMETLWSGIELFYFVECDKGSMVSKAQLIYDAASTSKEGLVKALHGHFEGRCSNFDSSILIVDGLLHLDYHYAAGLELRPATLREWDKSDFDLAREIDAVLVRFGVKIGKLPETRIFFRSEILNG